MFQQKTTSVVTLALVFAVAAVPKPVAAFRTLAGFGNLDPVLAQSATDTPFAPGATATPETAVTPVASTSEEERPSWLWWLLPLLLFGFPLWLLVKNRRSESEPAEISPQPTDNAIGPSDRPEVASNLTAPVAPTATLSNRTDSTTPAEEPPIAANWEPVTSDRPTFPSNPTEGTTPSFPNLGAAIAKDTAAAAAAGTFIPRETEASPQTETATPPSEVAPSDLAVTEGTVSTPPDLPEATRLPDWEVGSAAAAGAFIPGESDGTPAVTPSQETTPPVEVTESTVRASTDLTGDEVSPPAVEDTEPMPEALSVPTGEMTPLPPSPLEGEAIASPIDVVISTGAYGETGASFAQPTTTEEVSPVSSAVSEDTPEQTTPSIGSGASALTSESTSQTTAPEEASSWIILVAPESEWAYAHWNISHEQKEELRQQGVSKLELRFYDVTGIQLNNPTLYPLHQCECDATSQEGYLPVEVRDRNYFAEIGYLTPQGQWMRLAQSTIIHIPPASEEEQQAADALFDSLTQQSPPPSSNLASASGAGVAAVSPSQPVQTSLAINVDLVFHGEIEPNTTLMIGNQIVQVNPDGKFRVEIPFPEGASNYAIVATSADGDRDRSIYLKFTRETPAENADTQNGST